ncbi:MAG: nicotinamide riboside transporter PnuC [Bacteroidales bacterium]
MGIITWLSNNYVEVFGAVTGILYVFLEIKQNPLLWPVGIITSGVYIYVFFIGKLYADMCLQTYYVVISIFGWYWWVRSGLKNPPSKGERGMSVPESSELRESVMDPGEEELEGHHAGTLQVTRAGLKLAVKIAFVFALLWAGMWQVLARFTDSPVPLADSFITSLSIVATWMLARKIYEHWYLWIVVNFSMSLLCVVRGMYPTLVLYIVYGVMSFVGLREWAKTIAVAGEKQ